APAGPPLRRGAVGAASGRGAARPSRHGPDRAERAVRLMAAPRAPAATPETGWFGHPRGLSTLFFTEMWERFSYYGMRAFLILYMVHALGFDDKRVGRIYGNYPAGVWAAAIVGGIVADWWLG